MIEDLAVGFTGVPPPLGVNLLLAKSVLSTLEEAVSFFLTVF